MGYIWYVGAEKCLERLSEDFLRIKSDFIDKKDYEGAYNRFRYSLLESNYGTFEQHICENFDNGISFAGSITLVQKALKSRNDEDIDFGTKSLITSIRQFKMRKDALENR